MGVLEGERRHLRTLRQAAVGCLQGGRCQLEQYLQLRFQRIGDHERHSLYFGTVIDQRQHQLWRELRLPAHRADHQRHGCYAAAGEQAGRARRALCPHEGRADACQYHPRTQGT